MQVSADDEIDRFRGESGCREVGEKRSVLPIELRNQRPVLRVTDTRVDDDAQPSGLDDERVEAHQIPAVGVDEIR
jgi:hypothetical protein